MGHAIGKAERHVGGDGVDVGADDRTPWVGGFVIEPSPCGEHGLIEHAYKLACHARRVKRRRYGTTSSITGVDWLGPPPPGPTAPPVPFSASASGVASAMVSPARWTSRRVSR